MLTFIVVLSLALTVILIGLASESPKATLPKPEPVKEIQPRFKVEIETVTVEIEQPEKKVSKFLVERGYLDPVKEAQQVLRIYVRDTQEHYYSNRETTPFAQIAMSDPEFDAKSRQAAAEAETRAQLLESLID